MEGGRVEEVTASGKELQQSRDEEVQEAEKYKKLEISVI